MLSNKPLPRRPATPEDIERRRLATLIYLRLVRGPQFPSRRFSERVQR